MSQMQDIRRGLAANLRSIQDCVVSPWLQESPSMDALSVVAFEAVEYKEGGFGALASDRGGDMNMIVEGAVSLAGGLRAAQNRFDAWVLWEVPEAIESDLQLTSRLQEDGTVLAGQPAACDQVAVQEFRGYRRERLGTGTDEFLIGDWVVLVLV